MRKLVKYHQHHEMVRVDMRLFPMSILGLGSLQGSY